MSSPSPTIEGFRAAFRRLSLTSVEIAWRWTFGATTAVLLSFSLIEYLDSVPASRANSALLSTRHPVFVARAITQMLRGTMSRGVLAALLLALALSAMWITAASIGRLATVRALIGYFREDLDRRDVNGVDGGERPCSIRALLDLNCLRVSVFLAVILALGGTAILAGLISSDPHPQPGLAATLFCELVALICIVGWNLNWWLSLAGMFAVRDGEDALCAFNTAVTFFRKHMAAVLAVSTWTGLAHFVAFSIAVTLVSLPLVFLRIAPRLVVAAVMFVLLAYFAVADWLYMARLAGYVFIAESPDPLLMTSQPLPPFPSAGIALESAIDHDELILSDIPYLVLET